LLLAFLDEGRATAAGRICAQFDWTGTACWCSYGRSAAISALRRTIGRRLRSASEIWNGSRRTGEIGKLDPVIGRDSEIRALIRILSRKTKNNPVLIGEAGVGRRPSSRAGAQDRAWRRAGGAQGPHDLRPRHHGAHGRQQVPWGIRRALEGGPDGDQSVGGARDSLHRRGPHDRGGRENGRSRTPGTC